jgi:EAL domain-containing protein (putative c-di-GMP-specific phosphodiesterase class I)
MADSAMYHAKKSGRDVACFSPQMRETAAARLELETSLWRAMQNGELAITFQPQVRLDGGIEGYEALLTWRHPRLGLISPSDFIPIAEQSGLIVPIGAWVLEQACRRCASWQRDSSRPLQVAVNVSAVQLARSDFIDVVRSAAVNAGLEPGRLELELTESQIMSNVEDLARCLSEIRQLGVRIAIDDFGTGYSSLSYLSRLPADTLKIDRSFLLEAESEQSAVLETIVKLAHDHGLRVVAEGVETKQQLSALVRAGCDLAQGYLFGLPTPNPEPHGEVAGV